MNPVLLGVCDTIESDIPGYETLDPQEKYFQLLQSSIQGLLEFISPKPLQALESITDYVSIEAAALGREGYGQSVRDANDLGLTGVQCHVVDLGGASVAGALGEADRIARSNPNAAILIAGADIPKSAFRQVSDLKRLTKTVAHPEWEIPYGATLIGMYALLARKQMHDFGIHEKDYEAITQYFRNLSLSNPRAFQFGKEITDKVLKKYLAPPYSSPMIAVVTDHGFATLVLGSEAIETWMKQGLLRNGHPILYLTGSSHCIHAEFFSQKGNLATPAEKAVDLAFERSGFEKTEVEYAWIYDCFTGMIVSQAAAYFGEDSRRVAKTLSNGKIPIGDREIPINLGGGILNYQAAMSMSGATGLVDVLSQYDLARNPIPNRLNSPPRLSLLGNNGGIDSINSVVLLSLENRTQTLRNEKSISKPRKLTLNPVRDCYQMVKNRSESKGTLLSYTTIFFNPGGDRKPPYILALVEVEQGFLMTNLYKSDTEPCTDESSLQIGMPILLKYKNPEIRGYFTV